MQYTVLLDNFEGPLDLLLQLVEREKLDVREVSLSQVTKSYIEHIRTIELGPSELSQFLTVATQLVLTKSKRVLPSNNGQQVEEEERDITEQLERYQQYRALANDLANRRREPFVMRSPKVSISHTNRRPFDISKARLKSVYDQLKQAANRPTTKHEVRIKPASLQSVLIGLIEQLNGQRQLTLERLLELAATPHEAILSFLAVLELAKQDKAEIELVSDTVIMVRPLPALRGGAYA